MDTGSIMVQKFHAWYNSNNRILVVSGNELQTGPIHLSDSVRHLIMVGSADLARNRLRAQTAWQR